VISQSLTVKPCVTLCTQRCPPTYVFSSYAISNSRSFKELKILEISIEFSLVGIMVQSDKGGGRILLGNNTGGRVVMLRLIQFHYVGVWMPTGLPCIHTYNLPYKCTILICTDFYCTGDSGPCLYCKSQGVIVIYHTNFCGKELLDATQLPIWRTNPCWLSDYLLSIHFVFLNRPTFQSQCSVKLKNV
jgi:hypothetical protein